MVPELMRLFNLIRTCNFPELIHLVKVSRRNIARQTAVEKAPVTARSSSQSPESKPGYSSLDERQPEVAQSKLRSQQPSTLDRISQSLREHIEVNQFANGDEQKTFIDHYVLLSILRADERANDNNTTQKEIVDHLPAAYISNLLNLVDKLLESDAAHRDQQKKLPTEVNDKLRFLRERIQTSLSDRAKLFQALIFQLYDEHKSGEQLDKNALATAKQYYTEFKEVSASANEKSRIGAHNRIREGIKQLEAIDPSITSQQTRNRQLRSITKTKTGF